MCLMLGVPGSLQSLQVDPSPLIFGWEKFLWQRGILPRVVCMGFFPSPESTD